MIIKLTDEAEKTVKILGRITKRSSIEVVIAALRSHEWVIKQQAQGKKIICMSEEKPWDTTEISKLIQDEAAAKEYFG